MDQIPPPKLANGTAVRVILNDRNRTPHIGTIEKAVWHFKDSRYYYFLVDERGKPVAKRYADEDLLPVHNAIDTSP